MDKDLICITAHCPTTEKRKILFNLVKSLQKIRDDFDLMVVSHTPISTSVQENIDWAIFDKDNEILKEWKYQNQPWFAPKSGKRIYSIFFGIGNTYLTLHKQLITGYAHAKTFGYKKVHFIEYDAYFEDHTEFYDNSKQLDVYDAILYTKKDALFEINLQYGIGNFHSVKIDSLPKRAFTFSREEILKKLEKENSKTTEKRTQDLYCENNNKVLFKDHNLITKNGNIIRLIDFHKGEFEMQWAVPYYNPKKDTIDFVCWNDSSDKPCDITIIVNNNKIFNVKSLTKFTWKIKTLGKPEEIKNIKILVNDKLKNTININKNNLQGFKTYNFMRYRK